MPRYTYRVPGTVFLSTTMPIIHEHGGTSFAMQKQPHGVIAKIVNDALITGLPYCYQIVNEYEQPLYSIDCKFPGIGYTFTDHVSTQTVSFKSHRVQLMEKAYSFTLSNHEYYIENDHTGVGHLKCDNTHVATVSRLSATTISREDTVVIQATTQEVAVIAAVLYHTFYYIGA